MNWITGILTVVGMVFTLLFVLIIVPLPWLAMMKELYGPSEELEEELE